MKQRNNGITLIALVITIIVSLILAAVSIAALTGENGILRKTEDAKIKNMVEEEKEIIILAYNASNSNNLGNGIIKEDFEEELEKNVGHGKTEVIDIGEKIEVLFKDSERYYIVDKSGNILNEQQILKDKCPGDITKDVNGNKLEENTYEIWCIEDLVEWSINYQNYKSSKMNLGTDLNFKSRASYSDSNTIEYGDLNNNGTIETLINELNNENGFKGIESFSGTFDGKNYSIMNFYQNSKTNAGLIKYLNGTLKNLTVTGEVTLSCGTTPSESTVGYAGGIIAKCAGATVLNCKNYVNVVSDGHAGGIVGGKIYANNTVKISNCKNYGNIKSTTYNAGGIMGYNWTSGGGTTKLIIMNCYNNAEIYGKQIAGGIAGNLLDVLTISNSHNLGTITSEKGISGGIIGKNGVGTKFINNYNAGDLSGKTIGAIIGQSNGVTLKNNYYLNTVSKGVGNLNGDDAIIKDEQYLKSKEFVDILNKYIYDNSDETSEYIEWEYIENEYPTLKN